MPRVRLESESAQILGDLFSIRTDLQFVSAAAERLQPLVHPDVSDTVLARALHTAAVIAYARCFATGKRPNRLSDEDLSALDPTALDFHKNVMDMRSKHLAHAVNPYEQTAVIAHLSNDEATVQAISPLSMTYIAPDVEFALQLNRLARELIVLAVQPRIDRSLQDARTEASRDIDVLRRGPRFTGLIVPGPDDAGDAR